MTEQGKPADKWFLAGDPCDGCDGPYDTEADALRAHRDGDNEGLWLGRPIMGHEILDADWICEDVVERVVEALGDIVCLEDPQGWSSWA